MFRGGLLILGFCLSSTSLACTLTSIGEAIGIENVHATFVQTKTIAALSRPLQSSGEIWMSNDEQLVWQVLKPLKSTLVLNDVGIQQYDKNDSLLVGPQNPTEAELSEIFLNLLNGNIEKLQTVFDMELSCNQDTWLINLTPTIESYQRLFKRFAISGQSIISEITIEEVRGDLTVINLTSLSYSDPIKFEKYLAK
jgi:outer membrane lipoprotein-sorting protein